MLVKSNQLFAEFEYLDFALIDLIEDQLTQIEDFSYSKYNVKHCLATNPPHYDPCLSITNKMTMKEHFIILKDMDLDASVAVNYAKEMYKYLKFRTLEKEVEDFNYNYNK